MKIVDKYIMRQLFWPFIFGLLGFLIIIAIDPLYFMMQYLLIKKIPFPVVLKWFLFRLVSDEMNYAFPMACLFAGLFTFGRLSSDSETVALRAGGVSFGRMTVPVLLFSSGILIVAFLFGEFVAPVSTSVNREIRNSEIFKFETEQFKEKVLIPDSRDRIICARKVDRVNNRLENITVYEFEEGKLKRRVSALYGYLVKNKLDVFSCVVEQDGKQELWNNLSYTVNKGMSQYVKKKKQVKDMSIRELVKEISVLKVSGSTNTGKYMLEIYSKTAVPFSCVIFSVIGACMGMTSKRSGSAIGFGISIFIIFIYYVIMSISKSLGAKGVLPPLLAAWLQNIVFFFYCWRLASRVKN